MDWMLTPEEIEEAFAECEKAARDSLIYGLGVVEWKDGRPSRVPATEILLPMAAKESV